MAKQKYYVVWQGHEPGIYESWNECQKQIKNYPGAEYKSFKTREEAEDAYHGSSGVSVNKKKAKPKVSAFFEDKVIWESWSVDAACSGNPGIVEYRGVDTKTGAEIFRQGPFRNGTNNLGEFLALVHALALLKKEKNTRPIYSDSRTAISWVKKKAVKTTLEKNTANAKLFNLVERALAWLKTNSYDTKIYKWDTANWGEIPADFGRK